jgi:hypothetical protein
VDLDRLVRDLGGGVERYAFRPVDVKAAMIMASVEEGEEEEEEEENN